MRQEILVINDINNREEILEELKKKYPKELFDEYDYIQGMWIKKKKK